MDSLLSFMHIPISIYTSTVPLDFYSPHLRHFFCCVTYMLLFPLFPFLILYHDHAPIPHAHICPHHTLSTPDLFEACSLPPFASFRPFKTPRLKISMLRFTPGGCTLQLDQQGRFVHMWCLPKWIYKRDPGECAQNHVSLARVHFDEDGI